MLSKYRPAQLAKSTAALLSALVLFLAMVGAFVTDLIPADSGGAAIGAGIALVCAWLVRTATFLTTSAPTLEQIAKHADDVIDLVREVKPDAIEPSYSRPAPRDDPTS